MQQITAETFIARTARPLELAVIVPVLNEHDNIVPLLDRLSLVLADYEWEAIFVDDGSIDGTPALIEDMCRTDRRVRLIRRFGRRGLSSAVVEGFLSSAAPVLAVIDGDMQHDEAILPRLVREISEGRAELAVGTRYDGEGGTGDWSADRVRISRWATRIAAPVMRTRLSDPMSGFFAIRRSTLIEAVPHLSSVGYKILLDIVASHRRTLKLTEIPYIFRARVAGASKLDSIVALQYFELLLDKAIGRYVPVKFLLFAAVGALGAIVHVAMLALLHDRISFTDAQIVAVLTAMTFNYAINNRFTYRDRRRTGWRWLSGYGAFALACSAGAVANVGIGSAIYGATQHNWWLGGIAGIAVGSVWNYVATRWLIWKK
ncbi:MAG TPA: glycosyltransferase family 2 protein [Sphingobium sp.]|uniref:glycosyltransferase family 2 protein n=1 Tax=Sphingobium sp. TaxID=1912891 RepID=UPI002ED3A858